MTAVADAYANFQLLANAVSQTDLGALQYCNEIGAKTLVVAAAGDLERRLYDCLTSKFSQQPLPAHLLEFVDRRAIRRQFHTYFDWKGTNANLFLSLFGEAKKSDIAEILRQEPYKQQVLDFLSIGRTRNEIVHSGLAEYSLNWSIDEVYKKYRNALAFVNLISLHL